MKKTEEKFNKINNPYKLLKFMSENINYGYLSKSGKVYHYDDANFNTNFFKDYIL